MRITAWLVVPLLAFPLAAYAAAAPDSLSARVAPRDSLVRAAVPSDSSARAAAPADSAARGARPRAVPAPPPHQRKPLVRPWGEFGADWVGAPAAPAHIYQASEALALGIEARPRTALALRLAADYQMMVANETGYGLIGYYGSTQVDTLRLQVQGNGWLLAARAEVGVRLGADIWVTGGLGEGYFNSGFGNDVGTADNTTASFVVPTVYSNAWGWLWTGAVRWDFEPAPEAPLGIDVRQTAFTTPTNTLHVWSIRLCYRFPEAKAHSREQPGHGRRRWGG